MKIRFLNTHEPVSAHFRDLPPNLATSGFSVEILISSAEYRGEGRELEDVLKDPEIRVDRVPAGISRARNTREKLWIMLTYGLGAGLRTLLGPSADVNIFLTQPPMFFFLGYVLKRVRGQRYCCLLMDIYPEVFYRAGVLHRDSVLFDFLRRVSLFTLRQATRVVVIGRCMRDFLIREGVPAKLIVVIENWVNERDVYPIPPQENTLRRSLGLCDHFVVCYSGNLGISHYFDDLIEVCRRWRDMQDFKVVVFGGGQRLKEFKRAIAEDRLSNIMLMPFQPSNRRSEAVGFGDLHFISLRAGFEGLVVPSKAYGALATGSPIVYQGEATGEIARLIEEEQVGTVVSLGDADGLAKCIRSYYEDRTKLHQQGQRALWVAAARCGRKSGVEKFMRLMRN